MNALQINYWLKQHWKLLLIIIVAIIILTQTIYQIIYPSNRLIPGTKVDGVVLGGMKKSDAAKKLDGLYGTLGLKIYFGKNGAAFLTPKMSEVGVGVDNSTRIEAIKYPFYLRMIPGSIYWAQSLSKPGDIAYTYDKNKISDYTQSKVGSDCSIKPQNASLKLVESKLQLVPSSTGGTCDITQFQQSLAEVQPDPDKDNNVHIDITETPAPISDDMARDLAAKLNTRLAVAMPIAVDASTDTVPGRIVLSWLDFTANVPEQTIDNSGNQTASLQFSVNQKRMEDYLDQGIAAKLVVKPGVSKVSTLDFTETSRVNGATGRAVNIAATSQSVGDYINNKNQRAVGATIVVGPTTLYTRNYTPSSKGFSALLAQYAQDNPGAYSMAFTELSGVAHLRTATFQSDNRLPAAGIHALYLGYTETAEETAGTIRPVDIISGDTNASTCFKQMLQSLDLGCRTGFYKYFGYATLVRRGSEMGLTNTIFAGEDTTTSAGDLQKVMIGLYKNTIGKTQGAQRVFSTLHTSSDSSGVPAGLTTGTVTHIVGMSDTAYNDSAIVSTSYGVYALTVMNDDPTGGKIAGLVKKVQALKTAKEPKDAY